MAMAQTQEDEKAKVAIPLREKLQLSGWMLVWFYATAVICTWDATFIMLRPYSLPGGSLATFWYFYKYYVTVDQRYLDVKDAFVFAQSLLNYGEVVFNIITIIMHYRCSRHTTTTAFMVSVMTMWKTILYFLMFSEFCTGGAYRHGNTAMQEFFLVVIPNVIWVIVPLCIMFVLWHQLTPESQVKAFTSVSQKSKGHKNGYSRAIHILGNDCSPETTYYANGKLNGYMNGSTGLANRNVK